MNTDAYENAIRESDRKITNLEVALNAHRTGTKKMSPGEFNQANQDLEAARRERTALDAKRPTN